MDKRAESKAVTIRYLYAANAALLAREELARSILLEPQTDSGDYIVSRADLLLLAGMNADAPQ